MEMNGIAALVTGGASGLGGATAARLAKAGAKVTLFDVNAPAGEAHAQAIGGRFLKLDVTDAAAAGAAVAEAERHHGVARVLVNCAGIAPAFKAVGRDGLAAPLGTFAHVVAINLTGTFNMVAQFAARLQAADTLGDERGVIINTASIAAFDGQVGQAAYAASKAGVVGMALPLARELARYGIRVMTIAPGIFLTPMMAGMPPEVQASLTAQVPFPHRAGHPDEYAQLAEAIITNPMLNGEVIRLDGAVRMGAK